MVARAGGSILHELSHTIQSRLTRRGIPLQHNTVIRFNHASQELSHTIQSRLTRVSHISGVSKVVGRRGNSILQRGGLHSTELSRMNKSYFTCISHACGVPRVATRAGGGILQS